MWTEALALAGGQGSWKASFVVERLDNWCKDKAVKDHKALPSVVYWALCLAKNEILFQKKNITLIQVIHQIRFAYGGL